MKTWWTEAMTLIVSTGISAINGLNLISVKFVRWYTHVQK